MVTLKELLRERGKRRKAKRPRRPSAPPAEIPAAPAKGQDMPAAPADPRDPLEVWKAKRSRAVKRDLSAGELANMIEGLTPDGFDKKGRKVSFVEGGQPAGLVRLSEPARRRL